MGKEESAKPLPWIDTRFDIPYPKQMFIRNAEYVEAQHSLVNPFPHRAVFDVMTMLQLLAKYDIQEVAARSKSPTILVKAQVSKDDREKAKQRGYRWEKETTSWVKHIKEIDLETERADAGFQVDES